MKKVKKNRRQRAELETERRMNVAAPEILVTE